MDSTLLIINLILTACIPIIQALIIVFRDFLVSIRRSKCCFNSELERSEEIKKPENKV